MRRSIRWVVYALVIVLLAGAALSGPSAWATPGQSPDNQTIPTRTPKPPPQPEPTDSDPDEPTSQPPPLQPPGPGPTVLPGTVLPGGTPLPVIPIAPAAPARLTLAKRADRDQVWPGMTVSFTLTLSNRGSTSIQGIVVEDPLPPGLEPREILEGSGAFWDQNSLVSEVAVLPPGGRYTVIFSALVGPDATAEPMLQNRATATAANGLSAQAIAILVLPPLELPPTGDAR